MPGVELGAAYKRYVLSTMTAVLTLNYVDRGLVMLLLEPMKADLHLSDTQLGFLTGIAFALFYTTVGLPIARWADRGNRVTITSIAIGLWGITVMSCVFVGNFVQLVFARIAAAIGEAGCMPPTYSLVGDYFPRAAERTRAIAIYFLGNPLASLVSMIAGGWLNERYGWRATFFIMGIPALLLAVLVKWTVREPRAWATRESSSVTPAPAGRMSDVFKVLWHQRSSRHLTVALILVFTLALGLGPWYASFLMRSHAMATTEVGLWLGLGFGVCGIPGTLLGGYVAARAFPGNERGQMRLSAVIMAALCPCFLLFLLLPHKYQALSALLPLVVVFNFFIAPSFALMQRLVVDEMRATMMALVMLLSNLIGMGLGPQLVGILSDTLSPTLGPDSLRYAMAGMSCVALWAAWHFWRVGHSVADDLARVSTTAGA